MIDFQRQTRPSQERGGRGQKENRGRGMGGVVSANKRGSHMTQTFNPNHLNSNGPSFGMSSIALLRISVSVSPDTAKREQVSKGYRQVPFHTEDPAEMTYGGAVRSLFILQITS